ncbi:MAG: trigger factor [Planctomycetota bacterium]|nr:trigger factor [Planctomycetota bacterium]MDA1252110.1 trigger factor [Planctomycetota bacterium]
MSAEENAPVEDAETPSDETSAAEATDTETSDEDSAEEQRLSLTVEITDAGPCRKKIRVVVAEADIADLRDTAVNDFTGQAEVPGFRKGHVPRGLVESKFRRELGDELKQRVLVQSLEQLTMENNLDPIDEPDMDVESLEIPEHGDFEYSFEVEVRPEIDLPDFTTVTLKRATREITDEDVQQYIDRMLQDYGEKHDSDGAAKPGDIVAASVSFQYKDATIQEISGLSLRIQPELQFNDGEIKDFDKLMDGAAAGDTREVDIVISDEAQHIPMRGETVKAVFTIDEVKTFVPAKLDSALLDRIGIESEEGLREEVQEILERQVTYRQRRSAREQLLEVITESASWELPEELVMKQVENALHREILEMQQAGYSDRQIQARENELRQTSVSTTRQAMKEHFVLDKIATVEAVVVTNQDIEMEIMMMSFRSGETPRRLRARLVKTGVIENLEAQIRERKAVDIALERAQYEEVPLEEDLVADLNIEAIDQAICTGKLARAPVAAG